jgi:hypothetical protein
MKPENKRIRVTDDPDVLSEVLACLKRHLGEAEAAKPSGIS